MMRLREEAEKEDYEAQQALKAAEDEEYLRYKQAFEQNLQEQENQYHNSNKQSKINDYQQNYLHEGSYIDNDHNNPKQPLYGKYYSGGGGDREGYRAVPEDNKEFDNNNNPYAPNDPSQYHQHHEKKHSDSPYTRSSGIVGKTYDEELDPRSSKYMGSILSIGYNENIKDDNDSSQRISSARLSGRKSAHTYGDNEEKAYKKQQQQQYREEIAKAAALKPIQGEYYAKFRSEQDFKNDGINLPGNSVYNNQNMQNGYGKSSGGGKTSFLLG
eukprot:TRINITY_DN59881_c0_g2_i1.p1 TRINITY_DN59881_c0_g2~~TRINITY_DN59881_c0_g2_i1.p1  ORF type:complete len:288 (+),score=23.33 TRINITY_DN59881_c0_g2_i1:53-865(+)